MDCPFMELPELAGKVIESMRVYNEPANGREVHLAFTDGTQISVDLAVETRVNARHYRADGGELAVLHEHCDSLQASAV